MSDLIDRDEAIKIITSHNGVVDKSVAKRLLLQMKSAQQRMTATSNTMVSDTVKILVMDETTERLPSAEPEKEIPRRVLWSGWKGTRYTRYKCPNCNKPVKNDDVYCHRCGQKLMFPHISHTPYIEGQKQELIVRWDDEE